MTFSHLGTVGNTRVPREIIWGPEHLITAPVVLSLLAVVSGYDMANSIKTHRVVQSRETDRDWSEFLSFILSYPPGVSLTVEVASAKAGRNLLYPVQNGGGIALLASGGLDSTAAILGLGKRREPYTVCWVDYGQPYREAEERAILSLQTKLAFPLIRLKADLSRLIASGSQIYGHVVPARNVLLATLAQAATRASTVCIVSLRDEEVVPDKSPRFYSDLSSLLGIEVLSPFSMATKTDLIAWWNTQDFRVSPEESVSCYSHNGPCGACRACMKRAIAFSANGRSLRMRVDPFEDRARILRNSYLPRWGQFSRVRQLDLLLALERKRTVLPPVLLQFVDDERSRGNTLTELFEREAALGRFDPKWPT